MILLADIIDAQEALRIGLVNRVVPADQLEPETLKLAERLAQGPTVAHGLAKTGVYQGLGMSLEKLLNMEARNQAIAARTADRAEGVAAFREKRPPHFTWRAGPSPARARRESWAHPHSGLAPLIRQFSSRNSVAIIGRPLRRRLFHAR